MADAGPVEPRSLAGLLPDEVRGWRCQPPDGFYDHETLFELIDGGAEVYRALNVRTVVSRRYLKPAAPEIIVDVFDMGSAADAFGAFHHDMREGEDVGVGDESEAFGGSIAFWRDRFFVSEVGLDDDTATCNALRELGDEISAVVPSTGEPPELVRRLPVRGLVKSQIHYFHDKSLLDRHLPIHETNVLDLDGETEVVVARYRIGQSGDDRTEPKTALLLARYPTIERARAAHRELTAALAIGPVDGSRGPAAALRKCAVERDTVVAIFGAPSAALADELIAKVQRKR